MPDTPPSPQQPSLWEILAKHRHYCTQPDKFNGLSDVQAEAAILALLTTAKLEKAKAMIGMTDDDLVEIRGYNQGIDAQYAAILRRVRGEEI